ncbi:MAG: helix-turn-helix transcriptional regulator [Candidatus Eremiobacteraeota bacterium]|nr:helix-turn-helix transcriptional regulator [Candidatus Eremiobacteraeota bacterium]
MSDSSAARCLRRSLVRGCVLHEVEYDAGSHVRHAAALRPTLIVTLSGNAVFAGDASPVQRMVCAFAPAGCALSIQVCEQSWRAAIVGLGEAWALDAVRDLDLRIPCSASSGRLYRLGNLLEREMARQDRASSAAIPGIVLLLIAELARVDPALRRHKRPHWLDSVRAYLDDNFRAPQRLRDLAQRSHVHPAHLSKAFMRAFGCTIGEYVRERRVDYARRQLELSQLTLSEIAVAAGFADQSHFAKTFKRIAGLNPAEYRARECARFSS